MPGAARSKEDDNASRRFVLQVIQPGLVGLMDGSVSTLAPVFAAAFATHNSWNAFLVGLAASLGAGISMGFAEALADDGKLSGRGTPLLRGFVCGLMTIAGGIGHTIPYLIPNFYTATIVAAIVVLFELLTIAWIQWRYMRARPRDRHPHRQQLSPRDTKTEARRKPASERLRFRTHLRPEPELLAASMQDETRNNSFGQGRSARSDP